MKKLMLTGLLMAGAAYLPVAVADNYRRRFGR